MEEYLRNMKNLRAQMNDFEEEAASISVEEQKQKTVLRAIEKELESVRLETKRLNEEANEMTSVKAQICCQISEKQKKFSSLETESTTLSQTLELLQKESIALQEKLKEERLYYGKVREELNFKLQNQQEWVNSQKLNMMTDAVTLTVQVEDSAKNLTGCTEGRPGSELLSTDAMTRDMGFEVTANYNSLMSQLESARAKLEELKAKTSEISLKSNKSKKLIAELQLKIAGFPSELKSMETKTLEEEHQALLSDKAGEVEYLLSLQERIEQVQAISEDVKCQCGKRYKVDLSDYAFCGKSGAL